MTCGSDCAGWDPNTDNLFYKNDYAKALATYAMGEDIFEGGVEYRHINNDDKFIQGAQSCV